LIISDNYLLLVSKVAANEPGCTSVVAADIFLHSRELVLFISVEPTKVLSITRTRRNTYISRPPLFCHSLILELYGIWIADNCPIFRVQLSSRQESSPVAKGSVRCYRVVAAAEKGEVVPDAVHVISLSASDKIEVIGERGGGEEVLSAPFHVVRDVEKHWMFILFSKVLKGVLMMVKEKGTMEDSC
jgi:hypothetical protein